jgi:hypothetical protein
MQFSKRQLAIATLLIAVSILALQPSTILATPNPQSTMSLNASGQAFPIGNGRNKGTQSSATLTMAGNAGFDGNQLEMSGLSGILQIGPTSYSLTGGQGEGNKNGELEIQTKSADGKDNLELVLHGNLQGNNVAFTQPQSKLASLFFLSLSGQITVNPSSSTSISSSGSTSQGQTVTVTQTNTVTQQQNVTTTKTQAVTKNNTATMTIFQNLTTTVTQPAIITATLTVTKPQNVTITVTQTGTNSTITRTVTTVSNSTITQIVTVTRNVTVTVP